MHRPRFTLRTLLLVVAACALGSQMMRPEPMPRDDLTPEMFDRVNVGMSRSQILAMYGPPHGDSGPPFKDDPAQMQMWRYYPGFYVEELRSGQFPDAWGHNPQMIVVFEDGIVVGCTSSFIERGE